MKKVKVEKNIRTSRLILNDKGRMTPLSFVDSVN